MTGICLVVYGRGVEWVSHADCVSHAVHSDLKCSLKFNAGFKMMNDVLMKQSINDFIKDSLIATVQNLFKYNNQ